MFCFFTLGEDGGSDLSVIGFITFSSLAIDNVSMPALESSVSFTFFDGVVSVHKCCHPIKMGHLAPSLINTGKKAKELVITGAHNWNHI